jgi:hypothetical protein
MRTIGQLKRLPGQLGRVSTLLLGFGLWARGFELWALDLGSTRVAQEGFARLLQGLTAQGPEPSGETAQCVIAYMMTSMPTA